jgi:hypothetical protein
MFKNRFLLVLGVLSVLMVTMAISHPFASAPTVEERSEPPQAVIAPPSDTANLSDYYDRHPELQARGETVHLFDTAGDFYQRHPEWTSAGQNIAVPVTGASDYLDYFQRHPEQPDAMISPIDECFDVSVSELAACREANQSAE